MPKKSRKKQPTRSITQEDYKLIVPREMFAESVNQLIDEGNALNKTRLLDNDGYRRWLNRIENNLRVSFDNSEFYVQEYIKLGGIAIFTSDMDAEKELHNDLTVVLAFLKSLIDRLPYMPSKMD